MERSGKGMCTVRRALAVILAGGLLSACGGQEEQASVGVVVTDSAGITIVDNGPLDATLVLETPSEPTLAIGVLEGATELQLFRVSDVKRLSDGSIAIANAGTQELRIFNADGSHRVTAGGSGQGPSEFRYPSALVVLPGDTVMVQDFLDRVYFTADGDFVRRTVMDWGAFQALWSETGGMSEGGQWLADGTLFAPVYHWDQNPPVAGPLFRPRMTFVRIAEDLTQVDTLGEFGGILQQYVDAGGDRGPSATVPPFATNTSWALGSGDGSVIAADNAVPQIEQFLSDGTRMIVRWTAPQEPVSGPDVEEWKEHSRNASWAQDQLPRLERAWAAMDIPDTKPYYGRVFAGTDGTTWVGSVGSDGSSTALRAFLQDGTYAGQLNVPGRFIPHDSGDNWVIGVMQDDAEVEFVWLFEFGGG